MGKVQNIIVKIEELPCKMLECKISEYFVSLYKPE